MDEKLGNGPIIVKYMNGKSLGMKVRHMGMDWLWIDDQHSSLSPEPSSLITEINSDYQAPIIESSYLIDGPTNVTLEISEEPEYKDKEIQKLEFDEYPGVLPKLRHKSFVPRTIIPKLNPKKKYTSPWYVNPKKWNNICKTFDSEVIDEKYRLENLYHFLHKKNNRKTNGYNSSQLDEKYNQIQETMRNLDIVPKYQKYLQSKHLRLPSCLRPI